jgi:hypothetical protein
MVPFFLIKFDKIRHRLNVALRQQLFVVSFLFPFQGDQIGQIFAYWVIYSFGQFFLITKVGQNFGLLFSMVEVMH